jgi:cytochrome c553
MNRVRFALATLAFAMVSANAGIADTKHNLSSGTNSITGRIQSDQAEICVFCHTPHGADTTAPAPLWNKKLGAAGTPSGGGSYTTYASLNTPSLDGTIAPVGSISVACLSCHDGTSAMDNIINAPGSGGYDPTGGGTNGLGYTWTGANVTPAGKIAGGITLIGTDLSNDHPIGVQYCGGGLSGSGTVVSGTCKDSDFKMPETTIINGNQVFWVETGLAGKQRTDLPLYSRAGADASLGPLVECATCHDPHVSPGQAGPAGTNQVSGNTFLRISNNGSGVCLTCHIK